MSETTATATTAVHETDLQTLNLNPIEDITEEVYVSCSLTVAHGDVLRIDGTDYVVQNMTPAIGQGVWVIGRAADRSFGVALFPAA